MTVFGVALVRDEADIIEHTVLRMLDQVDEVIVADNGSTDGTREVLESLPVILVDDPERGYYQSRKTTRLAHLAAEKGATWVVPFDADEVMYAPFHERIADLVEALAPQWLTAEAKLYDHVATGLDDLEDTDPLTRICYRRREPGPMGKVACRIRDDLVINQGNHSASYEGGTTEFTDHLVIRHFPYRSGEQMVRKAKNGAEAYAATDLPEAQGEHWRKYGQLIADFGEERFIEDVYRRWFFVENPDADPSILFDPCP